MPEHTRYALFQLYCDLRANPPRDRHWFLLHARRLRPHTFSGWIVRPLLSTDRALLHAFFRLCQRLAVPAFLEVLGKASGFL